MGNTIFLVIPNLDKVICDIYCMFVLIVVTLIDTTKHIGNLQVAVSPFHIVSLT